MSEVTKLEENVKVEVSQREVVYPNLEIKECSTNSPAGPLTAKRWKTILGWETEKEFKERMVREKPDSKPEHWVYGDLFHGKNTAGEKVRLLYSANNRPFDELWSEDIEYMVLTGRWAGPYTVPGETVNGETVRISRYGEVLSGQHQGWATIIAQEKLDLSRGEGSDPDNPRYPFWNGVDELFIETILVTGLSEDPRVLQTIDYVKPRTMGDVLYTMDVFRRNTPAERKEMTRMLAIAAEVLWERTDAKGYQTHPEMVMFIDRHKRLLKAVEHLFMENNAKGLDQYICSKCRWRSWILYSNCQKCGASKLEKKETGGRSISNMRISAGQAAALLYLMGCSRDKDRGGLTDGDKYRHEKPAPSEKNLDWSLWDTAREFWARLARDNDFLPVKHALARLIDSSPQNEENQGLGGRNPEKVTIIQRAWDAWSDWSEDTAGQDALPPFSMDDLAPGGILHLEYNNLDDKGRPLPLGHVRLLDDADFGGIDIVKKKGKQSKTDAVGEPEQPDEEMTEEELDNRKREERERKWKEEEEKENEKIKRKEEKAKEKRIADRVKLIKMHAEKQLKEGSETKTGN